MTIPPSYRRYIGTAMMHWDTASGGVRKAAMHEDADEHVAARRLQLLDAHDAGDHQQHDRDRHFERDAERQEHHQHEIEVVADVRHHRDARRRGLREEREHHRENEFVGEAHADIEEQDRRDDQRYREASSRACTGPAPRTPTPARARTGMAMNSATKKDSLNGAMNGETTLVAMSVAPFGSLSSNGCATNGEQVVRPVRARNEHDHHHDQAADQSVTQLQQMRDQRAFLKLFRFPAHGSAVMKSPGRRGGSS